MRLISTVDLLCGGDIKIVDVREDAIPQYAILSHRWADDEVSYQEVRSLEADDTSIPGAVGTATRIRAKKGYVKVKTAAELAASEGYQFLWVDTCCIDKTSSAELSEAINSMYRWYAESTVCYAYLADVPEVRIRHSEWFERGWTLQELIAPSHVKFFDGQWSCIGQKTSSAPRPIKPGSVSADTSSSSGPSSQAQFGDESSAEDWSDDDDNDSVHLGLLEKVTGIDKDILSGQKHTHEVSVAKRMSWASRRVTTRPEDVAYCLLGIFNVNMPLLYGEGGKAFIRLQEAILKERDDQSIFAWWSDEEEDNDDDRLFGLLAPSPRYFFMSARIEAPPTIGYDDAVAPNMSSKGLQVSLYFHARNSKRAMDNDYAAVLSCFDGSMMAFIWLRNLWGSQYARFNVFRRRPALLSARDQASVVPGDGWRTIYVRQKPQHLLPSIIMAPLSTPRIRGVDIATNPKWDYNSRSLQTISADLRNHVALLTLQVDLKGLDGFKSRRFQGAPGNFNVLAGFNTNILGHFESWCFVKEYPWPANHRDLLRFGASLLGHRGGSDPSKPLMAFALGLPRFVHASVDKVKVGRKHTMLHVGLLQVSPSHPIPTNFTTESHTHWQMPFQCCALPITVRTSNATGHAVRTPTADFDWPNIYRHLLFGDVSDEVLSSPSYLFSRPILESDLDQVVPFIMAHLANDRNAIFRFKETFDPGESMSEWGSPNFRSAHWAVLTGKARSLPLGEDSMLDDETDRGVSLLHVATLMGRTKAVRRILSTDQEGMIFHERVNRRTFENSWTPLHFAAVSRTFDPELLALLSTPACISSARRPNVSLSLVETWDGQLATHIAASFHNLRALDWLLDFYDGLDQGEIYHPCASRLDHEDFFDRTGLWHAAAAGFVDGVATFLRRAEDDEELKRSIRDSPDYSGRTPLLAACRGGHTAVVRLLLEHGADPDEPCVPSAALLGREMTLAELPEPACPVVVAANFGHAGCLRELARRGADIDCDWYGDNRRLRSFPRPVHYAAALGHRECVDVLIEFGAALKPLTSGIFLWEGETPDGRTKSRRIDLRGRLATPSDLANRHGHNDIVAAIAKYLPDKNLHFRVKREMADHLAPNPPNDGPQTPESGLTPPPAASPTPRGPSPSAQAGASDSQTAAFRERSPIRTGRPKK